jgi:hypothetical protein
MRKVGLTKAEIARQHVASQKSKESARWFQDVSTSMSQCDIMGIIVPASWVCLTMAVRISTTKVQANTHNQAMPVMILNGQWLFTCSHVQTNSTNAGHFQFMKVYHPLRNSGINTHTKRKTI